MIRTYEGIVNQLESHASSTIGFNLAATYLVVARRHPNRVDVDGKHYLHDDEEQKTIDAEISATARWIRETHGDSMTVPDFLVVMEKEKGAAK